MSKDMNLVEAIKTVEQQIAQMEQDFQQQIAPYRNGLKALRKMNTVCTKCGGSGKRLRPRACAEDDRPDPNDPTDYITCEHCHGTGKEPKE